jgi:hypothetical protein
MLDPKRVRRILANRQVGLERWGARMAGRIRTQLANVIIVLVWSSSLWHMRLQPGRSCIQVGCEDLQAACCCSVPAWPPGAY